MSKFFEMAVPARRLMREAKTAICKKTLASSIVRPPGIAAASPLGKGAAHAAARNRALITLIGACPSKGYPAALDPQIQHLFPVAVQIEPAGVTAAADGDLHHAWITVEIDRPRADG